MRKESWATDGVGQRMELGNGWSWVMDGVGQRMQLGNGWSWVTDGVGQRMQLGKKLIIDKYTFIGNW
ncbi:MAG: hypothetical protein WBF90_21805 [Rivularia sp. (in: cyanobacteria)]